MAAASLPTRSRDDIAPGLPLHCRSPVAGSCRRAIASDDYLFKLAHPIPYAPVSVDRARTTGFAVSVSDVYDRPTDDSDTRPGKEHRMKTISGKILAAMT